MTAKQVLVGAAKRIETKGWIQGGYARTAAAIPGEQGGRAVPAGSPCGAGGNLLGTPVAETDVIGAMRQVGGRIDEVDAAKAALRKHLRVDNLADWNDAEGRTKEQVIAALNAAAKLA